MDFDWVDCWNSEHNLVWSWLGLQHKLPRWSNISQVWKEPDSGLRLIIPHQPIKVFLYESFLLLLHFDLFSVLVWQVFFLHIRKWTIFSELASWLVVCCLVTVRRVGAGGVQAGTHVCPPCLSCTLQVQRNFKIQKVTFYFTGALNPPSCQLKGQFQIFIYFALSPPAYFWPWCKVPPHWSESFLHRIVLLSVTVLFWMLSGVKLKTDSPKASTGAVLKSQCFKSWPLCNVPVDSLWPLNAAVAMQAFNNQSL